MNTKDINPGDVVECNRKGRKFEAMVRQKEGRTIHVFPLTKGISYYTVTSREIVAKKQ